VHPHEEELHVVRLRPEERLHQSAEQLPVAELLAERQLPVESLLHVEELPVERRPPVESLLHVEELLAERQLPVESLLHVEELLAESLQAADASLLHVEELLDADLSEEQLHPAEEFLDARLHLDAELLQEEDSKASRRSWAKS